MNDIYQSGQASDGIRVTRKCLSSFIISELWARLVEMERRGEIWPVFPRLVLIERWQGLPAGS